METEKLAAIIFCSIAIFGIISMYFLNATLRRHRFLYRFCYIVLAVCGIIGIPLLCKYAEGVERGVQIGLAIFWDVCLAIAVIHNVLCIKMELESDLVKTTLVNCTETVLASHRRYNVRITGTSLEGAKDSFLMQYPKDILLVESSTITPQTVFMIYYYDKTKSIKSVERYY